MATYSKVVLFLVGSWQVMSYKPVQWFYCYKAGYFRDSKREGKRLVGMGEKHWTKTTILHRSPKVQIRLGILEKAQKQ